MDGKEISNLILEAYERASDRVQAYIPSGQLEEFEEFLKNSEGFDATVAEAVAKEVLMLILGITDVKEFPNSLKEAGVPESRVEGVIALIDTWVFEPLRADIPGDTSLEAEPATKNSTDPNLAKLEAPAKPLSLDAPDLPPTPINRIATRPPAPVVPTRTPIPPIRTMKTDAEKTAPIQQPKPPKPVPQSNPVPPSVSPPKPGADPYREAID